MVIQVQNLVLEFFEKLDFSIDNVEVIQDEESIFTLKIKTPESGLIIGPHGKNLGTFETLLRLLISRNLDKRIKLHVEVNDYQESRDDRLQSFIQSKVIYVEKTGKDLQLPYYSAYERKKIHGFVGDMGKGKIYTKSVGKDKERRLYICKKDEKLTIDIDGDDI